MSALDPRTREEFGEYILQRLGAPMLEIDVTPFQLEAAIQESLKWYWDYHYNGSEHTYYFHKLSADDISNQYVVIPEDVFGINEVYSFSRSTLSALLSNPFSPGLGMVSDILLNLTGTGSLTNYYMTRMNYEFMQQIMVGQSPIRFNEHDSKVYIDKNWGQMTADEFVVFDAYRRMEPENNPKVWGDRWLLRYAIAKTKYQWAANLSKFVGVSLPGGVTFNAEAMRSEAEAELIRIEEEMLRDYSIPPRDVIA